MWQIDEAQRLAALMQTGILDTPPDPRFDDLVQLARDICGAPMALVSLVDADRQWFKASAGWDHGRETPLSTSVCKLVIEQDQLFVIGDLAADPRTRRFAAVTEAPHLRFYAGFPIITGDGWRLGSLCVLDVRPRPDGLTAAQGVALEALAHQAAREIARTSAMSPVDDAVVQEHSVGSWDWDVVADRVTASPSFARLYGVEPGLAAVGAPIAAFFANIHRADLPRVRAEIDQALATGEPFESEYRLIDEQGGTRWVVAQGRASYDRDGRAVRFPGVSFDIDERKKEELRLAAVVRLTDRLREAGDVGALAHAAAEVIGETLDAVRAGYGTIDADAETIAPERHWLADGVAPFPPLLHFRDYGTFIDDLKRGQIVVIDDLAADPRTAGMADAAAALSVRSLINLPLMEDGRFVALLFVNDDRPRAWTDAEIGFVRDVAERTRLAVERRRAELELAQLNASLEQQVEARTRELLVAEEHLRQAQKMEAVGQLTGGLAHDFNNLLTGISGALEMMQIRISQGRFGDLERYAGAAQGAAKRAAALTHRLLAFSRRQTLDPKPTDVNRLVAGLEELIGRTVGPGISLEVVGAAGLWPALVDPNQLENAILNLCINARDAMPDGGRITIETANKWLDDRGGRERGLQPGQYLSICVTDTGSGMSPEVQERAFDPFFTTKPLGEGTGLGLSMIYGFARQSGGQVRIYSEEGQGTTMCIYLPRFYGDADEEGEAGGDMPVTPAAQQKVVLVVDDEPTIRMLVLELLDELGHTVLEAGDGAGAMRLLDAGARVDLLITDVGLPGDMNGRQVADAAIARLPDLKVLFITGYAENAVIGNGQLEPNMALITKPFAMEAMTARVQGLLA
jgi:signal transduction histidine kinase/CheY-like chemotaxis protein/PAS domain-containing protein